MENDVFQTTTGGKDNKDVQLIGYEPKEFSKIVEIPKGVTDIGGGVFNGMIGIEQIIIPNSVRVIRTSAFESMDELKSVVIPEGVKEIHGRAFYRCNELKEISFPSTIEKIGSNSFYRCLTLETVFIPIDLLINIKRFNQLLFTDLDTCPKIKRVVLTNPNNKPLRKHNISTCIERCQEWITQDFAPDRRAEVVIGTIDSEGNLSYPRY